MSNRPEAGERSGLAKGESASNPAATRGDAMSRVGKQGFRESELRPHSIAHVTTAFAATALVVMGTLVVTGALLLIIALIHLGIDSARSFHIHFPARQITGDAGT